MTMTSRQTYKWSLCDVAFHENNSMFYIVIKGSTYLNISVFDGSDCEAVYDNPSFNRFADILEFLQ